MFRYAISRILWAIPSIFGILVIAFVLTHVIPGDPVQALIGNFPAPPGYADQIRHLFGLDQPLYVQFWLYFVNLGHGDLGFSFAYQEPVMTLLLERSRFTLLLMIPALVASSLAGIGLGLLAAQRAGSAADVGVTAISIAGASVPVFWLAQLLVIVFAVSLGVLPAEGITNVTESQSGLGLIGSYLQHLILPGFTLTVAYMAIVARVARSSVLEAFQQDYVLTARAKGLTQSQVLWRHVLNNGLIPVITVIGFNFGYALTGAILTETVFGWPGLGGLFITSVNNRDYPVLEGIFLFTAVSVVVANLLTDLLYVVVDPRIRRSYARG